jgi:hypothetical protein
MPTLNLHLTLEADVIQTAEASSLGVHQSLEYIRGSALLGAAAAKCYGKLKTHAYTAFHSGRVRFLDAVLLTRHGVPSIPVPLGWFHPKEQKPLSSGCLDPDEIYAVNHLQPGEAAEKSLRQMRAGFFTAEGQWLKVHRLYRLKTAIDRTTRGRPNEGSLFGYESIPAGSQWLARVEIDEGLDEGIEEILRSVFDDSRIWLGRSRAAEYGRVHVRLVQDAKVDPQKPSAATVEQITICLESDTALLDRETEEPTLTACPEHFGLPPAWRLINSGSAVATRRFSPFNGKRHRRDLERLVLSRGSVLTFGGEPSVNLQDIRASVRQGVGCWRQEGLGQVHVAPWYLGTLHPQFNAAVKESKTEVARSMPAGPLALWAVRQAKSRRQAAFAFKKAQKSAGQLVEILSHIRRRESAEVPTRTQWNRLAGIVRSHLDQPSPSLKEVEAELAADLFRSAPGSRGVAANVWQAEYGSESLSDLTLKKGLPQRESEPWDNITRLWCLHHTALLIVRHLSNDRFRQERDS